MTEDWYAAIDPEVREIVRDLRDNGVNTTHSSGQPMTIEIQLKPVKPGSQSTDTLFSVLKKRGIENFSALYETHVEYETGIGSRVIVISIEADN